MTPRSFFAVCLKIAGLYLIFTSINLVSQFVFSFVSLIAHLDSLPDIFWPFVSVVLIAGLYYLLIRYCIFKPDIIIDKLQLDKGFSQESFSLNMHRSTILNIAVIVIGGVVLVETFPALCRQIFVYVQQHNLGVLGNPQRGELIFCSVKTISGYLLMISSRWIVNLIERQRKK